MSKTLEPPITDLIPKGKAKKKVLFVALPLLLVGAGAGGWFSGLFPRLLHGDQHDAKAPGEAASARTPTYIEMPEIIANLNTGARRAAFIKLKARLELAKAEDASVIQSAMPRILDLFQTYLREMRPEEMRSSASTYRLREELLSRTNIAGSPAKVVSVLFTELIVQ